MSDKKLNRQWKYHETRQVILERFFTSKNGKLLSSGKKLSTSGEILNSVVNTSF
jgi:hypothetical protein